jgi:pyrrolidone-carboxylate peptidase
MKSSQIRLHLTSYGPFLDILDNPSQRIAERLEPIFTSWLPNSTNEESHIMNKSNVAITSFDHCVLEVSMDAVDAYFSTLAQQFRTEAIEDGIDVFIHMGVAPGNDGILRAEVRGYNELHCPRGDFKGVKRLHEPIRCDPQRAVDKDAATADLTDNSALCEEYIETTIPLAIVSAAVDAVNEEKKRLLSMVSFESSDTRDGIVPGMVVSRNAGRYLCNYCTYHTMQMAHSRNQSLSSSNHDTVQRRCYSMFIHVLDPKYEAEWAGGEDGIGGAVGEERQRSVKLRHNPSFQQQAECVALFVERVLYGLVESQ